MTGPVVIATLAKNSRERVRIALDNYRGHDLVDLRVVVQLTEATGIWTPTAKGISLRVDLLPDLIKALQEAELEAKQLGLIGRAA